MQISPTGAHTHYFPVDCRLHHHWQAGHSQVDFSRSKRVHLITAHVSASRGFVPRITPTHARSASCCMGNSHGKLLSAYGTNQALPGAPMQSIKANNLWSEIIAPVRQACVTLA